MPCSSSAYAIPTGVTLDPGYRTMLPAHSGHVNCQLVLIFAKCLEMNFVRLAIWVQQNTWNFSWMWACYVLGLQQEQSNQLLQVCRRTTQAWWDSPEAKGLLENSVYPAGFLSGISALVERWAADPLSLSGRRNSFYLPRWSCSAPAWQVTSRTWNQTSASHRQTHQLVAKHIKDFMLQGRDLCWCSEHRILL